MNNDMIKQSRVTQLDLDNVSQVYHNFKYNDGEIVFADNITSIPGLMKKFQVNFIAYVMVLDGSLSLELNAVPYQLGKNCSLVVDRKVIIDNIDHSDDFRCQICAFSSEMGFSFISKSLMQSVMHILKHPVIEMGQDDMDLLVKYRDLLVFKMDHPEKSFGRETMRDIIRCFAYDLLYSISKHLDQSEDDMLRQSDRIFRRFMLLLADGNGINRSVKSFADELCVSPKYLTSVCHKHSEYTASELIASSAMGRIKQLLLYSDMSIKEVAAEMGFDNLSFFGKYVRKHLGLSPNNYRKANGYGK